MRVNVDEKWKSDPRRKALVRRLGSDRLADGMLVEITWILFSHKGEGIPVDEFQYIDDHEDWVACGLGYVDGDWVRIAGSDRYQEFFGKQSQNGSKGGRPKKPKITQNNPTEPNHNPEKPSSSSSSSFSKKIQEEESAPARGEDPPPELPLEGFGAIEELSHGPFLSAALTAIPKAVQKSWLDRYDTIWLKGALTHAVEHHLTKARKRWPNGVSDWGKKFDSWLACEKSAVFKSKAPGPRARAAPPEIEIPIVTAEEALSNGAHLKLGPGAKLALARSLGAEAG